MRRGGTDLSFVVGIDKPQGCTSHDVVNRCRRIFGEKRVGHTGTLDPMASGAMAVCVGPATKLSNYLTFHDKAYLARIVFGTATDTDDAEGSVVRTAPVPEALADAACAQRVLDGLVGKSNQLPPAYSAKKVGGVKSYEAARRGQIVDLRPREVEVFQARLAHVGREADGALSWDVRFDVSAGTYIRSIARDLGLSNGTCAHLGGLRRVRTGLLAVGECVAPDALEADPRLGRIDPIRLLGVRYAAADSPALEKAARNGGRISPDSLVLMEMRDAAGVGQDASPCLPAAVRSERPLGDGELVGILNQNKLIALYAYEGGPGYLKPQCGFAQGVSRGIV